MQKCSAKHKKTCKTFYFWHTLRHENDKSLNFEKSMRVGSLGNDRDFQKLERQTKKRTNFLEKRILSQLSKMWAVIFGYH